VAAIGCCFLWPNSVGTQGEMSAAWPVVGTPKGGKFLFGGPIYGYRDIDLQATKNFELGHGLALQIRFDALNILNFKNYSDTNDSYDGAKYNPYYNPIGNIYGTPRTYKLTADIKF